MKTTSHDLVAIARIAMRCQFDESQLKGGGTEAERIISTMIREPVVLRGVPMQRKSNLPGKS